MRRFAPYPRRALRSRYVGWGRRNPKAVVALAAALLIALVVSVLCLVALLPANGFRWYLLGVVQAAAVAGSVVLYQSAVFAHDPTAVWQLRGAWGEEATRDELRRARRCRVIWGSVDSIGLQAGDLDHVVVARRGGLVVLDSKWRSDASSAEEMVRAAESARRRTEAVARSVLGKETAARHRARTNSLTVRVAVVVWGPLQQTMPDLVHVDGIDFVPGRHLRAWLRGLDGPSVPKDAAQDALRQLREYRAETWAAMARTSRTRSAKPRSGRSEPIGTPASR